MISWLIHHFVKDYAETNVPSVRYAVGRICGYVGIVLNFLLFLAKYIIGVMVGSIAIRGDAINNLTDALNNIVSIISFHISEKPADKEHPYGHERTETITALFMGMIIVYLGFEMMKQSIEKIIHPGAVDFQWSAVVVLVLAIAVKFIMYAYNHKYGKEYDSELLLANALDSRNDVIGTAMVLASTLISPLIHYDLDGIMGVIVSLIILQSAYDLTKDVINRLLGEAPNMEVLNQVTDILLEDPMILDIHDVIIHSYGPKNRYATAHAEVDSQEGLIPVHSHIDTLERRVQQDMGIDLVIHVDPVRLHDPLTIEMEETFVNVLESIDEDWSMHDFRVENLPSGKKEIFFDLVIPYAEKRNAKEIEKAILEKLGHPEKYHLVMRIEHPYS